jgi:hypothetical protein
MGGPQSASAHGRGCRRAYWPAWRAPPALRGLDRSSRDARPAGLGLARQEYPVRLTKVIWDVLSLRRMDAAEARGAGMATDGTDEGWMLQFLMARIGPSLLRAEVSQSAGIRWSIIAPT